MSACQHHTSPCHSSLGYTSLVQTLLLDNLAQISKESNVIISDKYLPRRWQLEEVIVGHSAEVMVVMDSADLNSNLPWQSDQAEKS